MVSPDENNAHLRLRQVERLQSPNKSGSPSNTHLVWSEIPVQSYTPTTHSASPSMVSQTPTPIEYDAQLVPSSSSEQSVA